MSELFERLERVVEEWSLRAREGRARAFYRQLVTKASVVSPARAESDGQVAALLSLPPEERPAWVEARSWGLAAAFVTHELLEIAEPRPPAERLAWTRLARQIAARADLTARPELEPFLRDNRGLAALLEARALRRLGRLAEARQVFAEQRALVEEDEPPRDWWPSFLADYALTAGLLALDEYRPLLADAHFSRAARYLRVTGTEYVDAELLFARARLDLVNRRPADAVDRLLCAEPFTVQELRLARIELLARAALRTRRPSVARPLVAAWTMEQGQGDGSAGHRLVVAEAALRVLESKPGEALDLLAPALDAFRAAGCLLGSLGAALVAARAELARNRRGRASNALAAGVLERFDDIPRTPGVESVLAEIVERTAPASSLPSPLEPAFLDRLELWLILAEDSPGVGLEPQA